MGWLTALTTLVGPVSSMVSKWQERRGQVAAAKHEANLERIRAQKGDWKDEFVLIVVSAPILCAFVPPLQDDAFRAFEYMDKLPEWYMGLWVIICASVFGVNQIPKFKK